MSRQLGLFPLIAYGLPALPLAILTLPVYIYLPKVYAGDLGLGLAAVGSILLIARLVDAASDPVIGILGDATKSRLGRRKLWIIAGAPLVALGTWHLFLPPDSVTIAHLLIWSLVLYIGWTMMILPLNALGAELSTDYHERSRIAGIREGLIVLGSVIALAIAGATLALGGDDATALRSLGWLMLALLPVTLLVFWFGVAEPEAVRAGRITLRAGLRVMTRNSHFRRLILAYLLNGIANGLPATLFLLFVEFRLERPDAAGPLLILYFLAGVVAIPLWLRLSRRFGKHWVWCAAMLWACAVFACVPLLGVGDVWGFAVISGLSGLALGADLTLPAAMQADVVDQDTLETGQQRTGLYFALWSMATKLALALAVGLAFPLLDLAGFDAEAEIGTTQGLWALVALYAAAPILFKLAAIALIRRHELDEETVAETRAEIENRWISRTEEAAA